MQWKQAFALIPVFQSSLDVQMRLLLESIYPSFSSYTVVTEKQSLSFFLSEETSGRPINQTKLYMFKGKVL